MKLPVPVDSAPENSEQEEFDSFDMEQEVETEEEETPETVDEPSDEPAGAAEEVAQEQAPDNLIRFQFEDKLYEYTPDQMKELHNGYLRQSDYTRKTQYLTDWYQRHQEELEAFRALNQWMQLNPDGAKGIHSIIFGGQQQAPTQQPQMPPQSGQTVDQLLEQQAQQPQTPQPDLYQQQLLQYMQVQQQELEEQRRWREDMELDRRINMARQKYGNFDLQTEENILRWMDYLHTDNPEHAILRMYQEYQMQQAPSLPQGRPVSQPAQAQTVRQPQQPAPRIESGRRSGVRGVAANRPARVKPAKSYEEAARRALEEWG